MASEKQIEANRRNARKSTGPKSAEGKERMRFNAMTHGLTARTVILPGEDAGALERRIEAFKDDVQPRGALEVYLVERAAHVSWQLDRAERTIAARLTEAMLHGPAAEANRQADEVAVLARQLFWDPVGPICDYPHTEALSRPTRISRPDTVDDPLDPARIVNRLEATAVGCRWLLDRWGDLRRILHDGLKWAPPDRLRAVRLLGKQPLDASDDERVMMIYLACWAMDPAGPHGFLDVANELGRAEKDRFLERIDDRGAIALRPADPAAGEAVLLAIVTEAVTRLEARLGLHLERQALERPGRLDALAFDDSDPGERLRRYQLACGRTLMRTIGEVFKIRRSGHEPGAASPDRDDLAHDPDPSSPCGEPAGPTEDNSFAPPPTPVVAVRPPVDPADETNPIPAEAGPPTGPPSPIPAEVGPPTGPPLESRVQAEKASRRSDETNPIPASGLATAALDPCSEGLRLEAAFGEQIAAALGRRPTPRGRSSGGRGATSRPISPIILAALRSLAEQQKQAASTAGAGAGRAAPAAPSAS